MSNPLVFASYCETLSMRNGTSKTQYAAGVKLIKLAMNDIDRVDVRTIAQTSHDKFRAWHRVKLKNAPAGSYRVIVEIANGVVTVHAILPRTSDTYDIVEALWKKRRTLLPTANNDDE